MASSGAPPMQPPSLTEHATDGSAASPAATAAARVEDDNAAPDGIFGRVTATLYQLSESEPIRVTLYPDASIGQLLARLKQVMPEQKYTQYVQRGSVVLLGDYPQSWALNDVYTRFMSTGSVKKTLLSGTALHFNLVLHSVL